MGSIARGVAGSYHSKDLGRRRVVAWTAALIRWRDAAPVPWCRNIPVHDIPATVSSGAADANALFCPWRRATRGPGSSCDALPGDHGNRYASDSNIVALDFLALVFQALAEAKEGTAKPTWGFDVCETLFFNKPCYAVDPSRMQKFSETSFDEWVDEAKAPALSSSLILYNELLELCFYIIVSTNRSEFQHNSTEANLYFVGYRSLPKNLIPRWFHLSYDQRFSEGGMMVADVKEARLELLLESK